MCISLCICNNNLSAPILPSARIVIKLSTFNQLRYYNILNQYIMPIYTETNDDIPSQQQQQRERSNSISPTTSMADLCLYSTQHPNEQSEPLKDSSSEVQPPTHHKKVASIDSLAYTISAESDSTLPTQNLKSHHHHRQVDSADSLSLTYTNTSSEEDEVFQKVDYLSSSERDYEEKVKRRGRCINY